LLLVVVVEIVQKNDCVLVEVMMMMMNSFFFFSLYPGQGEVLNYLDNLFGGKGMGRWEASSHRL